MNRSKPLTRNHPMRKRRARRIDRKTEVEREFTAWIHEQRCVGYELGSHACWGRLEQSHLRNMTGLGRKESDFNSIPMCQSLHRQWEQHTCRFHGWSKEERRVWFTARIVETQARYELETGKRLAA